VRAPVIQRDSDDGRVRVCEGMGRDPDALAAVSRELATKCA
jgi:hypothetical protein